MVFASPAVFYIDQRLWVSIACSSVEAEAIGHSAVRFEPHGCATLAICAK